MYLQSQPPSHEFELGAIPIKNPPHKRRNKRHSGLSTRHRLRKAKQERQITMNSILLLQFLCRLNPLPRTRNLDQNPLLIDPQFLVQLDDVQCFLHGGFLVKREAGVDFSGHTSRDDFQDFLAEFDEETVEGIVDLVVDVRGFGFAVCAGCVNDFCVRGLLGGGEEEGGVPLSKLGDVGMGGYVVASWGLYWAMAGGLDYAD